MEIPATFRRDFFTEEISRIFGYSRVFLSLTQALDVEILLTSVLLYLSLAQALDVKILLTLVLLVSLSCTRVEIMGLYRL